MLIKASYATYVGLHYAMRYRRQIMAGIRLAKAASRWRRKRGTRRMHARRR
jgi:hypothetical protein